MKSYLSLLAVVFCLGMVFSAHAGGTGGPGVKGGGPRVVKPIPPKGGAPKPPKAPRTPKGQR